MAFGRVCEPHERTNSVCSQRHGFMELPMHQSGRAMEIIVFLTNSDVTSFDFTFIFIFLYEFMISDPLFHIERLLFFVYVHICIFVCMQATLRTVCVS